MDKTFTSCMQEIIEDNPFEITGIESIFSKLSAAFESNLTRLRQSNSSADLDYVSRYYSTKLVSYMRDVLHIIPTTILDLVSSIVSIQSECALHDLPSKISLDHLRYLASPERRARMLELTFKISQCAENMLKMQNTSIGLIQVDTKQLLEDGIRRELVTRMSDAIHQTLKVDDNSKLSNTQAAQNLMLKLNSLETIINGYKRSFEYIQDCLFIYGLRIWQEELSRIIKFNVEQAIAELSSDESLQDEERLSLAQSSVYQSSKAPIPVYSSDSSSSNFIIEILNQLIKITDPKATLYSEQMSVWFDLKSPHNKVADVKLFELVKNSLYATGLNGLDQVCCASLRVEVQKLDTFLTSVLLSKSLPSQNLQKALAFVANMKTEATGDNNKQLNRLVSSALSKLAPYSERIVNHLLRIGQLQAMRTCIGCVLSSKCRYEARNLYNCLETLNTSLLSALQHGKEPNQQKGCDVQPDGNQHESANLPETQRQDGLRESQLIFELANHLDWIGLSDPLSKVYTLPLQASNSLQMYDSRHQLVAVDLIFLILLDQCSKFQFSRSINGLMPKQSRSFCITSAELDAQPLFYGITTLINHYQPFLVANNAQQQPGPLSRLMDRMVLFIRCSLDHFSSDGAAFKSMDLPLRVVNMIFSTSELIRLTRAPANNLLADTVFPKFLLDALQYTTCRMTDESTGSANI